VLHYVSWLTVEGHICCVCARQMVLVKNRCVGILHYLFMFMIFSYILFYVFLTEKRYLEIDMPVALTTWSSLGPCQPKTPQRLCSVASPQAPAPAIDEFVCTGPFQCDRHQYCLPDGQVTRKENFTGSPALCLL